MPAITLSLTAAQSLVDSLELALEVLVANHTYTMIEDTTYYGLGDLRVAIEDLQMIRVDYMLAARRARGMAKCTCNATAANRAIGNHFNDCPLR